MTTTTTVLAWHGDEQLKAAAVARMRQHAADDRLIRGSFVEGWNGGWKGCLHGCLTAETLAAEQGISVRNVSPAGTWHAESERLWGIPRTLGRLLDNLYESSQDPPGDLAVSILEAIPVGADLAPVADRLMLDLLADPERGVWLRTNPGSDQRAAVERVAGLYRRRLGGDEPDGREWRDAAAAAGVAADAAYAAYAAYAADAAADAAAAAYAGGVGGRAWWAWWAWWQDLVLRRLAEAEVPA